MVNKEERRGGLVKYYTFSQERRRGYREGQFCIMSEQPLKVIAEWEMVNNENGQESNINK